MATLPPPPLRPINPENLPAIEQFAGMYPFPLDDFQVAAYDTLLNGESVMVAAPTGTGKTIIADAGIYDAFKRAGRVFYTTPIKALSNQKFRDLSAIYGDEVGLLTGDVSENRDARVLVMTTEILRNMLLQAPWEVDDVESIIFDEIHFLADPERGTTWEEAIILCPEHIQLICLSATVSNAPEIAAWISRTHRPIRLITHTQRAVPLALYYFIDQELHEVVDHTGALVRDFPHTGGEARRSPSRTGRNAREKVDPGMEEPQPHEIIDALTRGDMLPVIYFLFSRADCQSFAERLAVMRPGLVTPEQRGRIDAILDSYSAALRPEDRELTQVALITDLARKGIGFHHAGLLPVLKQLVEVLFTRGLMQVVFATDTLALGVNMPARSVVIGRMSKWDGRRRRTLIANEFQQMAGRAGRRGMDAYGHVLVPYSPWISFRDMLEVARGELEPVRSAFAVRYNTVLHLWDPPRGDRVRQMLRQSLAQFQTSQRIRQLEDDILEINAEIAGVPRGCLIGYEGGDELLDDYRRVTAVLTNAEQKERRTRRDIAELARDSETLPWPAPGRPALRKLFRHAPTGIVVFTPDRGWGVYVGRGTKGGIGLFLFGSDVRLVQEYREIAYVSDAPPVEIPLGLIEPPDNVRDAERLVSREELDQLWATVGALDLPDLAAELEAHRTTADARAAEERRRVETVAADAAEDVQRLEEERRGHPCHDCPRRKEHRDYLARIESLDREASALEQVLARETDAEEARIRSVIWGIREVLHRFGYFRRGFATEKADQLAGLFDNDGLILCELIDRQLLDDLLPEELAEIFSWFSFDRDSRYANHFELPASLVRFRRRLEEVEHAVITEEREHGIFISEGHNPNFYGAALAWCREATMTEIGAAIELSEGDLVLTFNKTIDLVSQVREMLEDVLPQHPLIGKLRAAERLMKRGIVQQSLSLGFSPIPLEEEQGARDEEPGAETGAGEPRAEDGLADESAAEEAPAPEEARRKRAPRAAKPPKATPDDSVIPTKPAKRARKPKVSDVESEVPSPS